MTRSRFMQVGMGCLAVTAVMAFGWSPAARAATITITNGDFPGLFGWTRVGDPGQTASSMFVQNGQLIVDNRGQNTTPPTPLLPRVSVSQQLGTLTGGMQYSLSVDLRQDRDGGRFWRIGLYGDTGGAIDFSKVIAEFGADGTADTTSDLGTTGAGDTITVISSGATVDGLASSGPDLLYDTGNETSSTTNYRTFTLNYNVPMALDGETYWIGISTTDQSGSPDNSGTFSYAADNRLEVDNLALTTSVPEPATLALLALGGLFVLPLRGRRRQA